MSAPGSNITRFRTEDCAARTLNEVANISFGDAACAVEDDETFDESFCFSKKAHLATEFLIFRKIAGSFKDSLIF